MSLVKEQLTKKKKKKKKTLRKVKWKRSWGLENCEPFSQNCGESLLYKKITHLYKKDTFNNL